MATIPEGITQADIDRLAVLNQGLKVLQEEEKELKAKVKEAFENAHLGKGTYSFLSEKTEATVIVKIGESYRLSNDGKVLLADRFSEDKYPEAWVSQLDIPSLPKKVVDSYKERVPSLSISFAQ